MWMFTFFGFNRQYLFRTFSKFFAQSETWYLDYFDYAEFNGGVRGICFILEIPLLGMFGPQKKNF